MSEGELKKRLHYCLDNHYNAEGLADCYFADIDEAKKDLLTFKEFAEADMMPEHIYSVYISEKINKWFGDLDD